MDVITVAPQYDMAPKGSTYPINAVAIINTKMIIPTAHTPCLGDL